ncbi:MAG TPA: hypothetical protein VG223_10740 [Solirubrobacteraceae bacterium]|jgi:hypothetical protein|nr:hypothetical protein [Solirubrobacteraceae bacterium]
MLFDLRTRGRRRTVQIIYTVLALVMVSGLLLVGVGTGSGGGILNAFTNGGSNSGNSAVSAQEKAAVKLTQRDPTNPANWNALVADRWSTASQSPDYNSSTGAFSTAGKKELNLAIQDWQHYLTLTKTPSTDTAIIAAHAYAALGNFAGQASAWEIYANANPTVAKGFECLAAASYAAKATRKGDLAAAQALTLVPKAARFEVKQELNSAKTSTTIARADC